MDNAFLTQKFTEILMKQGIDAEQQLPADLLAEYLVTCLDSLGKVPRNQRLHYSMLWAERHS